MCTLIGRQPCLDQYVNTVYILILRFAHIFEIYFITAIEQFILVSA